MFLFSIDYFSDLTLYQYQILKITVRNKIDYILLEIDAFVIPYYENRLLFPWDHRIKITPIKSHINIKNLTESSKEKSFTFC